MQLVGFFAAGSDEDRSEARTARARSLNNSAVF
jgi:hypothetical protein